jgi:hypothetical protein
MIGSLLWLIRSAAIQAVIDGTEKITRKSMDAIPVDIASQAARARTGETVTGRNGSRGLRLQYGSRPRRARPLLLPDQLVERGRRRRSSKVSTSSVTSQGYRLRPQRYGFDSSDPPGACHRCTEFLATERS